MRRRIFALAVLFATASLRADVTLLKVAETGQQVPGMATGVVYQSLPGFNLNNAGVVAFGAAISGPGITSANNSVLVQGLPGSLTRLLQSGQSAPGLGAGVNLDFGGNVYPAMNQSGQLSFLSGLQGASVTTANNFVIYRYSAGSYGVVARYGDPAPSGGVYTGFASPGYNLDEAGEVAFNSSVSAGVPYPNVVMSMGVPGNVQVVAQSGMQAPSVPSGWTFYGLSPYGSFTNGGVGVVGSISDGASNHGAFLAGKPGSLTLLGIVGGQAPGLPTGQTFQSFQNIPFINSSGTVAFTGQVAGQSVVFTGPVNNPLPVLQQGAPVTGHAGITFGTIYSPLLTDSGKVALGAFLAGPGITTSNNQALFVGAPGNPTLVAQTGTQAPGAPAGAMFSYLEGPGFGGYGRLAVNASDQIVFEASLAGAGINSSNNQGVWETQPDNSLVLLAMAGQTLTVDGVQKTISQVSFNGRTTEEGLGTCFTDDGRVALDLTFTDGSQGLFIAAVPEPAFATSALSLLLFFRPRRISHDQVCSPEPAPV